MTPATIDVNNLILALKAQRNNALDDAAMLNARVLDLEKENAELRKKLTEEKPA